MAKKKSKTRKVKTTKTTKQQVVKGMATPADFGERIANKLFNW